MAFFQSFQQLTGLPEGVAYTGIFLLGAAIGSFLNVVIYRVPRGESIVLPNSKCPQCKSAIRPYDNIPIISWLVLAGKCRSCGSPISIRYPAVELLNAFIWLVVYIFAGFNFVLPILLVFASVMVALIFIDAEHMILPNAITYPFFGFVMATRILLPLIGAGGQFPDSDAWPSHLISEYGPLAVSVVLASLGAIAGGGSLWLVGEIWKKLRGVEAMGLGDVKMMFGVGALLGWRLALLTIFIGAFTGAVAGIFAIALNRETNLQKQIPFGIFLGTGAIVSLLFGQNFLEWYLSAF